MGLTCWEYVARVFVLVERVALRRRGNPGRTADGPMCRYKVGQGTVLVDTVVGTEKTRWSSA